MERKVLYIVDDNLMMREFLKNYLEKEYEVITFESGESVLSAITPNQKPDLLVLDYGMKGISGFELLRNLKTSQLLKHIPVLFLSGEQRNEIRIKCLQEGASDFMQKPFNPKELNLKVKQCLELGNSVEP